MLSHTTSLGPSLMATAEPFAKLVMGPLNAATLGLFGEVVAKPSQLRTRYKVVIRKMPRLSEVDLMGNLIHARAPGVGLESP